MSGAWVSRARLQAADGMPMPTKQMSALRSARAAAIVIISVALWAIRTSFRRVDFVRRLRRLACDVRSVHGESFRSLLQHVRFHPGEKTVAVAGDRVPGLIVSIVARIIAVRVGGMRTTRHAGNRPDRPARQDHRIAAGLADLLADLLDRDDRALRRQHLLLLHPDDPLQLHVACSVSVERM